MKPPGPGPKHPPSTILQFLERLGARFGLDPKGRVQELYPRELQGLVPYVREVLPVIKVELERRALLSKRCKGDQAAADSARLPDPGPRLGQVRVTNYFRGMNQIEAFMGHAEWIELGWTKRHRDGRKIAAYQIAKLVSGQTSETGSLTSDP